MVRRDLRAWGDLDRTLGRHRQRAMWLLHSEKAHGITKKIHMLIPHRWLRQDHEFISGTVLLSAVAWPEIHRVVADGDSAGVRIGSRVSHPIDHGGLTGILVARCREDSAWLK